MTMRAWMMAGLAVAVVSVAEAQRRREPMPDRARAERLRERLELTDKQVERLGVLLRERVQTRRDLARGLARDRMPPGTARHELRRDGRRMVRDRTLHQRLDRRAVRHRAGVEAPVRRRGRLNGQVDVPRPIPPGPLRRERPRGPEGPDDGAPTLHTW